MYRSFCFVKHRFMPSRFIYIGVMRRGLFYILFSCAFLCCVLVCPADEGELTPFIARRIIKVFDFNERPLGNLEDIPMYWQKIKAAGFVHYVNGKFDEKIGSPAPSFKLQLNGGNVGYIYTARRIPAFPNSDHKIIAKVRAEDIRYARGYLEAFYMDRYGNVLTDTIARSPLIGPESNLPEGKWRIISFELPYKNPDARFIGLAVFLVQQDHLPSELQDLSMVYKKDIKAAVWFDQITIIRLPQVRLRFPAGRFVYFSGENIPIELLVADPLPSDLKAAFSVYSLTDGKELRYDLDVDVLPAPELILQGKAKRPTFRKIDLKGLAPGSYRLELEVYSDEMMVISRSAQIAVLAVDDTRGNEQLLGSEEKRDFGVSLIGELFHRSLVDELVDVIERLGPRWLAVPIWRSDLPLIKEDVKPSPIVSFLSKLDRRRFMVVGGFVSVPQRFGGLDDMQADATVYDLFTMRSAVWEPELSIVLSRYADRISRWIIGSPLDCWQYPDLRISKVVDRLLPVFKQFQDDFSIIVNWPAMIEPTKGLPSESGYMIRVPVELMPTVFEDYFSIWQRKEDLWVIMEKQDLATTDMLAAMVDFCKRLVFAKMAGLRHIAVDSLWDYKEISGRYRIQPTPYYVAYANIINKLADSEYVGRVMLNEECSGFMFCDDKNATVVVLPENDEDIKVAVKFPSDIRAYDIWGRGLKTFPSGDDMILQYSPVIFISGLPSGIGRFISSVRFADSQITSRFGVHHVKLVFENVFGQSINGTVQLKPDRYWQFEPSGGRFILSPGARYELPMKLRFPTNEPIGKKFIRVRFNMEVQQHIDIEVIVPLFVSVSDLKMRVIWFVRDGRLVVVQEIRNTGRSSADLIAYLVAPDRPRMERQIRKLLPGQVATKEYVIGNWPDYYGKTIRVGFREIRGDRMGNEVLVIK